MSTIDSKQFIENQRQNWDRVASAWEKWDKNLEQSMAFVSYRLIGDARISPGQRVLDLGCGTGYPSILAAQAVGNRGAVVGLDLSENMLAVAKRKAEESGATNISFHAKDVTSLSYDAASFDAVISRFCLMFLPDIHGAMKEISRVLKSGGYLSAAVWSTADKNPFIRIPVEVLKKFIDIPVPSPDQPGIFRLARQGDLFGMAVSTGLSGVADEEVSGESVFDSPQEYLANVKEMAAPLRPLFARLTKEQKEVVDGEIMHAVTKYKHGDKIALPMVFRVVAARKP
ncbi:MAG TPA: class I SAM-dependent methyltransferase [Nitrospirota bacterium]|nr:class I SAM-dependent methyltransferase [Nitrospirota bacterium]